MAYNELITHSQIDKLLQGVAESITSSLKDVVRAGKPVGHNLQLVGDALKAGANSRGRAVGEVLSAVGQAMEASFTFNLNICMCSSLQLRWRIAR
ncbi:hypothetical protein [Rhizobium sp. RAF56]|uniref:hypothetical protein n=1 Tax=Rhizobium sp. RAF56 TaxID=3233062 RepID=UPI003F993DA2